MATHSSILAWRIPWVEEPGSLQSAVFQESDTVQQLNHHHPLITMYLGAVLFGLILLETSCASWTWMSMSFARLGNFSAIMSSNMFSGPFSLSSLSEIPIV